jgi:S1-C subfamily serine protease
MSTERSGRSERSYTEKRSNGDELRNRVLCLISVSLLLRVIPFPPSTLFAQSTSWVDGEMGYRITVVPPESPAGRHGLKLGDILAEPAPLPQRLADAGASGVGIPIYRLDAEGRYRRTLLRIMFRDGEEHRLGTTGDLGFLVTAIKPGSLGARAELKAGDFIPKIDDTFVHSVGDLKLVESAYEKNETVLIHFIRWGPTTKVFETAVSRQHFEK